MSFPPRPRPAPGPVLVRPAAGGPFAPGAGAGGAGGRVLDPGQQRVVAHRRGAGPLVVLGAPGTGRTTALVEALVARVERDGADPSSLLVLAPTRRAAAALRDRVSARLARTTTEPLARTPHAYAWALLRRAAVLSGGEPPRLLSGPEQDQVLADLLRGHEAGDAEPPPWPESTGPATRALRGFRAELRDLLMRALERGLAPYQLAELGSAYERPEWVAAAAVLEEYLQVTALASPGAHDPAAIVQDAAALLRSDPQLLAAERSRWSLVVVDDHQESTAATAALLDLVAGNGGDLVLAGDPDAATAGFRGGDPQLVVEAPHRYPARGGPAPVVVLGTRWRHGSALAAVSARIASRTGSLGAVAHREAAPSPVAPDGVVEAHVLRSPPQQAAFVASVLRAEHVAGGTPWGQMAVVVRSAGSTALLRRALTAAGVPVSVPAAEVPVRAEPAVVPLRTALTVVLRPPGTPPAVQEVLDMLTSSLGGADTLGLRRLRQALLAEERAGGGTRGSDALLVEAVAATGRAASLPARAAAPAVAVARVLAAGRAAVAEPGATAESVLWALWSATDLAATWRLAALAGGPGGARADRDLDAVVALFDAASRYEERLPGSPPQRFLEHLESQDVPSDTLADRAPAQGAVALVTAQGAAGSEWDVVVVPGLQEGAWPDTRLRGTLLGAPDLADLLSGRGDGSTDPEALAGARRQVLDDERRLLHVATTRARRRLVVTAVRDEDERPSAFLDLVCPPDPTEPAGNGAGGSPDALRPWTAVPRTMGLSALVGELRSVLLTPPGRRDATGAVVDEARRSAAAASLSRLAAAGVPGASPQEWYGLVPVSDEGPLREADQPVPVSPSAVESFTRCSLRWLLEASGGRGAESVSQGVGVLVHRIAQELPEGTAPEMAARLEELWPTLGMPDTWVGHRERRAAARLVERLAAYVAAARAAGRDLITVEAEVTAQVGRALVRGRLDRLERHPDGGVQVVDLKTGSRTPSAEELPTHPQLGLYQVLVTEGALDGVEGVLPPGGQGPATSSGASLVQLGGTRKAHKEQVQAPLEHAADPQWAHDLLAETAEGMAASAFDAVENDLCPRCPVRTCCPLRPEGEQVGP